MDIPSKSRSEWYASEYDPAVPSFRLDLSEQIIFCDDGPNPSEYTLAPVKWLRDQR